MVVTLLATLVVLCTTGTTMTTDAFWGVQWVDELHQTASDFSVILVGLHVAGVILESFEWVIFTSPFRRTPTRFRRPMSGQRNRLAEVPLYTGRS